MLCQFQVHVGAIPQLDTFCHAHRRGVVTICHHEKKKILMEAALFYIFVAF